MRALMPCGTPAAYKRHLDYHQPPCDTCRDAMRPIWAERAALRRTRAARQESAQAHMEHDIREVVHILACALGVGRTS
jgi:hypothetical protein